jgi:hypothetical protein
MPPEVIFRDDFRDSASGLGNNAGETGEMYYQNSEYVIRVSSYDWTWWALYPQSFMDCEIKVEARPISGENLAYGLVFRSWHDGRYFFVIYPDGGYYLRKVVDDQWLYVTGYAESDAIHQGHQMNRLRVKADGPQISLYVNDQLLQTVIDTTFEGGQIGLIVQHFDYQDNNRVVEVHFDNLEVRSLAQYVMPAATLQVTPTPESKLEQTPTPAPAPRDNCRFKHRVRQGEDLSLIALMFGVSVKDVRNANGAKSDAELLTEGNELCIPSQLSTWSMAEMPADPTPIPGSGCRFVHVVRPGDGWFQIVMRYGISPEEILKVSDIPYKSSDYVGMEEVLCIP